MTDTEFKKRYEELFKEKIPLSKNIRKTFLEIGGVPHFENIISKFYAFYFDKTEEHHFNDLFLKSICKLIENKTSKEIIFRDYSVYTELMTQKNGRMDIVIEENDETSAIIIENKIFHKINNDLEDYWDSIKASNKNKIGILLTLKNTDTRNTNFINITHFELIETIRNNIGKYLETCDDRHLLFMNDLFNNITNLMGNNNMNDKLKFYFENKEKISQLSEIKEEARKHFLREIENTSNILDYELDKGKENNIRRIIICPKSCLRFWIELDQSSTNEFITVYLDLFGKAKNKISNIDFDGVFSQIAKRNKIVLEELDEDGKDGISIAHKYYQISSDDFADLSGFFSKKLKDDWDDIINIVKDCVK